MFTIADIANGPAFLAAGLLVGGLLLLAVIAIEAVALKLLRWASFWRSARDALVANAASALVGLVLGCVAVANYASPTVTLPLLVGAWALSIVIEAGALKLLSAHSWREIWVASLVTNTASYVIVGPLFWLVLGAG